ncbi:MAG: 4Fe-4S binding protein, partial [Alphaproteobacteria bacterium]
MVNNKEMACRMSIQAAMIAVAALTFLLVSLVPAVAGDLASFQDKFTLAEIIPGADRLGEEEGTPPSAVAYKGGVIVGYVFLNSAVVNATGYSGKPIHVVVGMDTNGVITGAKMVQHHEPIVLVGIPVSKIHTFIDKYKGFDILSMVKTGIDDHTIDIVSGATVTVMIIDDTIIRAAIKVARARGIGGLQPKKNIQPTETITLRPALNETPDWQTMLGEGSLRRLSLSVGEVTAAFTKDGKHEAAMRPESGNPEETFIDFYIASADIPSVGKSLLGPREYANLLKVLKPGESAILLAGRGLYSFKGSGYVRGGIFDRFQLIQGDISIRFRDRNHKKLGALESDGTPDLREMDLFVIPADSGFDPARPWRIQLLVLRAIGAIKKQFITFDVGFIPPERYLDRKSMASSVTTSPGEGKFTDDGRPPLWQKIWQGKVPDIVMLLVLLTVLTGIFFFQNTIALRPELTKWTRMVFLAVTLVWMGFYEQAQLSVVNALTFAGSLLHGFSWDYFLMEPLIFILWGSVAASLIFWGRGVYCGWLCPFGALQELINRISRSLGVPQVTVPWSLHERLWP